MDNLYWQEKAQQIIIEGRAFINGKYCDASDNRTYSNISPIDGSEINQVALCSETDVNRAVKVAKSTFESGVWANTTPIAKKRILLKFSQLLLKNQEELALLETLDMGKPVTQSMNVDVAASANCLQWYAEAIDKLYDEVAPTAHNIHATITREPVGVVAAIIPWNFPMLMASWKYAPALATGNSIIIKPATTTPLTSIKIAALAKEAGIPDGVFNVVPGPGSKIGEYLGMHPDIDMVTFTGSTEVGKKFLEYSGKSNIKNISIECGGKSPHIITAECNYLDDACVAVTNAIFYNQGEVCTAGSRLLVSSSIKDVVVKKIIALTKKIKPRNPLDSQCSFGSIASKEQMNTILNYIKIGVDEGAKLVTGGNQLMAESGGFYVEPTILTEVTNTMRVAQEEIFGPVLCVISFETIDEAIAIANNSSFGLAAGVWSDNIDSAHKIATSLRSGIVFVNGWDTDDMTTPFGGYKQSGIGRDKSLHALEKYTELKSTIISYRTN